jgi:hypothetical protein
MKLFALSRSEKGENDEAIPNPRAFAYSVVNIRNGIFIIPKTPHNFNQSDYNRVHLNFNLL